MSSTGVAPPGKIKSCLVEIKERIVEEKEEVIAVNSLQEWNNIYFVSLLRMELLQRGVVVAVATGDPTEKSIEHLLENTIHSTAGKVVLDERNCGKIPLPLLTTASVMAGRVCEQCVTTIKNNYAKFLEETTTMSNKINQKQLETVILTVIDRCKEVQDHRLLVLMKILLLLLQITEEGNTNNTNYNTDNAIKPALVLNVQLYLLQLAKGYFLRSTHFQPDAPPIWKRVWDVTLQIYKFQQQQKIHHQDDNNRNHDNVMDSNDNDNVEDFSPSESLYPLINLIRIAKSKNNSKRVMELNMKLVESYIQSCYGTTIICSSSSTTISDNPFKQQLQLIFNDIHEDNKNGYNNNTSTNDTVHITSMIQESFINIYRKDSDDEKQTSPLELLQAAQETLEAYSVAERNDSNEHENYDSFTHQLLSIQIQILKETLSIEEMARKEYNQVKNRVQDSTRKKKSSSSTTSNKQTNNTATKSTMTMEECYRKARQTKVARTATIDDETQEQKENNKNDNLDQYGLDFLKHFLLVQKHNQEKRETTTSSTTTSAFRYCTGASIILYLLQRSKDCIQILSLQEQKQTKKTNCKQTSATCSNYWKIMTSYIHPIISHIQEETKNHSNADDDNVATDNNNNNSSNPRRMTLEQFLKKQHPCSKEIQKIVGMVVTLVPYEEWMLCGSTGRNGNNLSSFSLSVLEWSHETVRDLIRIEQENLKDEEEKKQQKSQQQQSSSSVILSTDESVRSTETNKKIHRYQYTQLTLQCLLLMYNNVNNDNNNRHEQQQCRNITEQAISMFEKEEKLDLLLSSKSSSSAVAFYDGASNNKNDNGSSDGGSSNIEFGSSYLQLLIAWSGLYQTPFSYCQNNIKDIRQLLRQGQRCLQQSSAAFGRRPPEPLLCEDDETNNNDKNNNSNMEQVLYKLAYADANCGIFAGGFSNESWNIYHDLLNSIQNNNKNNNNAMPDVVRHIMVSHCYIGLTRISLLYQQQQKQEEQPDNLNQKNDNSQGEENKKQDEVTNTSSTAEEYARLSLREIEKSTMDDATDTASSSTTTASFYLWKSIIHRSIQYHSTISRQLLADALLKVGKTKEVKQLLKDAIRDSPNDFSAVFSYASFLLREVFMTLMTTTTATTTTAPSPKLIKTVQTHLLKAAKVGAEGGNNNKNKASNPFALLGLWYEVFQSKDKKRIIGCYSKSLLLDPSNPIAGRGILRLTSYQAAQKILDEAVTNNSNDNNHSTTPLNGWAWYAIGKNKIMGTKATTTTTISNEGNVINGAQLDEFAVDAFLKALRCVDIEQPQNETLSFFYQRPTTATFSSSSLPSSSSSFYSPSSVYREKADILANLAMCYRRLGRYTASIRSFNSSMDAALVASDFYCDKNDDSSLLLLSPFVLCSCAQVELELGLLDEAANKFKKAIEIIKYDGSHNNVDYKNAGGNNSILSIATHGQGLALLEISRREMLCGKAGSSFSILKQAIEGCLMENDNGGNFLCTRKLLGDLYTFGASLPPDVFFQDKNDIINNIKENNENDASFDVGDRVDGCLRPQISFVQEGVKYYRMAINKTNQLLLPTNMISGKKEEEEEANVLRATLITDIGANVLLQGQLMAMPMTSMTTTVTLIGSKEEKEEEEQEQQQQAVLTTYEQAANEFKRAIEWCPLFAPAWCGLGCAVSKTDPLLAQHAFCRSIQLDNMFPDSYANLSFLYTSYEAFQSSESVLDALTQIADTPMMWINRALIFERNAAFDLAKNKKATTTATDKHANEKDAKQKLAQAVDAYRAALQVRQHPSAMLGLATTCRVSSSSTDNIDTIASQMARKDSYEYSSEYLGYTSSADIAASLLAGVMTLEKGVRAHNSGNKVTRYSMDLIEEGRSLMVSGDDRLQQMQLNKINEKKGVRCENLDLAFIEQCLQLSQQHSSQNQQEENEEIEVPTTDTMGQSSNNIREMSLSRRIMLEPDRGDLWVKLTKEICRGEDISKSRATMESAKLAADRAVNILTHHLTHPATSTAVSSSSAALATVHRRVDARDLSEALSLVYWLDNLENSSSNQRCKREKIDPDTQEEYAVDDKKDKEDKEDPLSHTGGSANSSSNSHLALQRSLIFCPNNNFAREALKLSMGDGNMK